MKTRDMLLFLLNTSGLFMRLQPHAASILPTSSAYVMQDGADCPWLQVWLSTLPKLCFFLFVLLQMPLYRMKCNQWQ